MRGHPIKAELDMGSGEESGGDTGNVNSDLKRPHQIKKNEASGLLNQGQH